MAKDKQFEPLKGSEGYDVWTSRMENLAKRKGLGALMHFGNDYANAMCDGDVDRFNGTDVDDETVNGEGELPTMSTARKAKEVGFETPRRQSKYGRKSFTTCRTIASSDNDRLYGLIIENVSDPIMLKLQRLCKGDGLGALDHIVRLYGLSSARSLKVHNLKAKINQLKATDCEDFPAYVEEIMQTQHSLESMGKGVEEDTIKTAIKLQAPEACENIIDMLDRTNFKGQVQEWADEILIHDEGKRNKTEMQDDTSKPYKTTRIASQANSHAELCKVVCQLCNLMGHSALTCPQYLEIMKRPKGLHCNFCKEPGHMVRDCPKAKYKDMMRAEELKKAHARVAKLTAINKIEEMQDSNEDSDQDSSGEDLPTKGPIRFSK